MPLTSLSGNLRKKSLAIKELPEPNPIRSTFGGGLGNHVHLSESSLYESESESTFFCKEGAEDRGQSLHSYCCCCCVGSCTPHTSPAHGAALGFQIHVQKTMANKDGDRRSKMPWN